MDITQKFVSQSILKKRQRICVGSIRHLKVFDLFISFIPYVSPIRSQSEKPSLSWLLHFTRALGVELPGVKALSLIESHGLSGILHCKYMSIFVIGHFYFIIL